MQIAGSKFLFHTSQASGNKKRQAVYRVSVFEDNNYVTIAVNVFINISSPCFPILHSSINQLMWYKTRIILNYNQPDEVVNQMTGCGMLYGLWYLLCSVSNFLTPYIWNSQIALILNQKKKILFLYNIQSDLRF